MEYDLKILRDYLLGDGYLVHPCCANAGSTFGFTQCIAQRDWALYKAEVFKKLGFSMRESEYQDKRRDSITSIFRTQATQEFRRYYDEWYELGPRGQMWKKFELLLNICQFDLESLMILYLDNGHSEIRKSVIRYNTKEKIMVNPFFDNLSICCPYRDSNILAEKITNLGFTCKALRPLELRSRVAIYKVEQKRNFIDCLKKYCEERKLESVFSYKYNLPVSGTINDLARRVVI